MASSERDKVELVTSVTGAPCMPPNCTRHTHYFKKIDGPLNPSDIGTKLQDYITCMRHSAVIHTKSTTVGMSRS
jgi:hypothetical protein